jgi:hypothetical protein
LNFRLVLYAHALTIAKEMNSKGYDLLPAQIAVRAILHVFWNISAQAFPVLVGNTQAFQLFRSRLHSLSRSL